MCLKKLFKQKKSISQSYLNSSFTSLCDMELQETQNLFFRLSAFLIWNGSDMVGQHADPWHYNVLIPCAVTL